MSGPFTFDIATLILRGPFQCSPIIVDVQGDKLRICCHLSKSSKEHASTNSFINTKKFPTRFGSAAEMAEIVSTASLPHLPILYPIVIPSSLPIHSYLIPMSNLGTFPYFLHVTYHIRPSLPFGLVALSILPPSHKPSLTVPYCLTQIANVPHGTQAMTLDIAKFHRTCPILPAHKPWFIVKGSKGFFIHHTCPFGCSSASSSASMIANAAVDIWDAEGVFPIMKYEDDLCVFRLPILGGFLADHTSVPYSFSYDRTMALAFIKDLNIPWHPDKGQDFDYTFKYISFLWNIDARIVSLPEEKRLKFLNRVHSFISAFKTKRCTIRDVMKIHGSLCHIAYVYPQGRNQLSSMSNFITAFTNEFEGCFAPKWLFDDLLWWNDTLSHRGKFCPLTPLELVNPNIYVDASTSWGIGIWFNGRWDAWRLADDWKGPSRDIGWLEGIALEFVIYILAALDFHDKCITIHSDNYGVIGTFDKGRCRNFEINLSIRHSATVLASCNIVPNLVHVASKANLPNPISRGILGPLVSRLDMHFDMPNELSQFFLHV